MFALQKRKMIAIMLIVAMIASMLPAAYSVAEGAGEKPALIITELVPDSENLEGADAYEFVELYNNSEQAISLNQYELRYRHGATDTLWSAEAQYGDVVIPAQSAIVLWITTEALISKTTTEMFNANYGTALVDGENLFKVNTSGGMHNSQARTLAIVDPGVVDEQGNKQIFAQASYQNDAQTVKNKGIFYRMPNAGSVELVMMDNPGTIAATPGVIDPEQLISLDEQTPETPEQPENPENPNEQPLSLNYASSVSRILSSASLNIEAEVLNAKQEVNGTVYYKFDEQTQFAALPMTTTSGTPAQLAGIQAVISSELLSAHTKLVYYIEAVDSRQQPVRTAKYEVTIIDADGEAIDAPALLVTELLPNSNNINSGDAYEFIEVYNNTDQDINFKDYKLFYIYTDSGRTADVAWPSVVEDVVIKSMDTMVFWVINSYNSSLTVNDFNREFGTALVENENIVKLYSDGMANGSRRGMAVATNTHQDISVAYYDGGISNVVNKGSHYQYQAGQTTMLEYAAGTVQASPGYVMPEQVPAIPLQLEADSEQPQFFNRTEINEIRESENLTLRAQITDNQSVKTVKLYYKTDKDADFSMRYLYDEAKTDRFAYTINSSELIGRNTLTYYFVYSDGRHTITSSPYSVRITSERNEDPLRLNVNGGQIISGTTSIKAAGQEITPDDMTLTIDGERVADTYASVESDAYFVFEAADVDYYFKNGVTIGEEIIHTFLDPLKVYTTITVPIEAERLKLGANEIAIRAGTKSGPFDDRPEENKDDFKIRNIRLILADGTNLYDPLYSNKNAEIKMGDSAGKFEFINFQFQLTEDHLLALTHDWDTTALADGEHTVAVETATEQLSAAVIVDNTAPVITPSITEQEQLRGSFTLDAEVSDQYAGVKSVAATLNGKNINLPYETTTGKLESGEYQFTVVALDNAGNRRELTVPFTIENDNPNGIEAISPVNGAVDVNQSPTLTVKVSDPQGDEMSVAFKRGFHYDSSKQSGIEIFSGASNVEPPRQKVPANEHSLTKEELSQMSSLDGQYYTTDATEAFPYQRFEIKLDSSVKAEDEVEIKWQGASLEGRKVSLYAWNNVKQAWDLLDYFVAGQEDFKLAATVLAGDYNDNGSIHVLVQDEMPVSDDPYDFTFVWMSDTQYYSESYPDIYTGNTQWIVDNKEKMDIRYIIHTGDIVDEADKAYQWEAANEAMKTIEDAKIPYGVLAGNHDVDHQTGDYQYYWQHYGEDRFKDMETYGGSYQNNRGHYDLISAGGLNFIIVYMGWNIGDAEIDWVNEVVQAHPDRKAILAFHEYLLVSNNRAPIADEIYERVVVPNKNVFATLSGHYHDAETLIDEIDDDGDGVADRKVYQMLADYQGAEMGGLGYIRLMQFDLANNKIHMKTYSPYLDDYNYYDPAEYPGKDEFDIDIDLGAMTKRVATDYFEANVYTEQSLGTVEQVASGAEASVTWNSLGAGTNYEWYVAVADEHSGYALSPIWSFTTASNSGTPTPTPGPGETPKPTPTPTEPGNNGEKVQHAEIAVSQINAATDKVVVKIEPDAARLELKLAQDAVQRLLESGKGLEVQAGDGRIALDPSALQQLRSNEAAIITVVQKSGNAPASYKRASDALTANVQAVSGEKSARDIAVELTMSFDISQLDAELANVYQWKNGQWVAVDGKLQGNELIISAAAGGSYIAAQYEHAFKDIAQGHWAQRSIDILAAKQIVNGVSATSYEPDREVTRADYATMLIRALGMRQPDGQPSFTDVADQAYYAAFVAQAQKLDIVQGSNNEFRPLDQVTREEAIVMLMRAYYYAHPDAAKKSAAGNAVGFADQAEISTWAKQAVTEAAALGLVQGKPGNQFDPQGELTRSELAVMIVNFLKKQ